MKNRNKKISQQDFYYLFEIVPSDTGSQRFQERSGTPFWRQGPAAGRRMCSMGHPVTLQSPAASTTQPGLNHRQWWGVDLDETTGQGGAGICSGRKTGLLNMSNTILYDWLWHIMTAIQKLNTSCISGYGSKLKTWGTVGCSRSVVLNIQFLE